MLVFEAALVVFHVTQFRTSPTELEQALRSARHLEGRLVLVASECMHVPSLLSLARCELCMFTQSRVQAPGLARTALGFCKHCHGLIFDLSLLCVSPCGRARRIGGVNQFVSA